MANILGSPHPLVYLDPQGAESIGGSALWQGQVWGLTATASRPESRRLGAGGAVALQVVFKGAGGREDGGAVGNTRLGSQPLPVDP